MATNWRDILAKGLAEREGVAVSAISAARTDDNGNGEPSCTNRTNCTVPADILAGVQRLNGVRPPFSVNRDVWKLAVADARHLLTEGWAAWAMQLGWNALDLFGAVPDKSGDPNADGLALKLAGRRVLVMSDRCATVKDDGVTRSIIYRGSNEGAVLLWELGRTQSNPENRA